MWLIAVPKNFNYISEFTEMRFLLSPYVYKQNFCKETLISNVWSNKNSAKKILDPPDVKFYQTKSKILLQ
jgi:hypothetical protein